MHSVIATKIQEMVDLETKGWDTKNPELFLSMIHPDMAWPFPPTADSHDPVDWVFVMGRFDKERLAQGLAGPLRLARPRSQSPCHGENRDLQGTRRGICCR